VHYRRTSGRHTRLKYGLWPLGSEMSSCMSILASTWGVVWNVIERDLLALKERVRGILAQEG
jgi:hypothetical protein